MAVTYFKFEEDFIEESVRCIPMIVRFKLDACGIKLKLMEWSKMTVTERNNLAEYSCQTKNEVEVYGRYVQQIVRIRVGQEVTDLEIDKNPLWATQTEVPWLFLEKLKESGLSVSLSQWQGLSALQRFALLKLCAPGHENKNFPRALEEFNLT